MEGTTDEADLIFDRDHVAALEQRIAAHENEIAALEQTVADQHAEVVAARDLHVEVAQLEVENATQALLIERMRERLRGRGAPWVEDDQPRLTMVSSIRTAAQPRMLAEPALRWIAEIIEAE